MLLALRTGRKDAPSALFKFIYYVSADPNIVLVMDNLNTHTRASLLAKFEAIKAYELAQKFEVHSTPKRGSWLNSAAIEIAALAKTCLAKRIANGDTVRRQIRTNVSERNKSLKPL